MLKRKPLALALAAAGLLAGEGLPDAEIVSWHVAEGDHVVVDQPLVAVETAKAVVEIPSPQAGRIAQLLARPGERVAVGAPLLLFEEGPHPDAGTVVGALETPKPPTPRRTDEGSASPKASEGGAVPRAAPAVSPVILNRYRLPRNVSTPLPHV